MRRFAREPEIGIPHRSSWPLLRSSLSPPCPTLVPTPCLCALHVGGWFQVDIAEDFAAPALRRLLNVLAAMERSA